ncbi:MULTISPECIES: MFS transporter [Actinokineospora]|uniref:MFS transporter n=1 Tax=Actinokineospora fastidiosa TaxID=1816 RepID=A0A918GEM4_9PSEU|nr:MULTISPECIES: MFS transporter [Actinokineospora]UVS79893.1 enterobactin exporter EntS [Actinokineospora sp. UTMC 2448]GGS31584.1 MFS transporter [Actinokineospora fastidiosa]
MAVDWGHLVGEVGQTSGAVFRALAVGEGVSTLGDQLARVAVAVLVFDATGSAAAAALTYAATLLPDLVAGPLLVPLADRYPRRRVMAVAALVQALLSAVLAIPSAPVALIVAAIAGIAAAGAPFRAAQAVTVRAVLPAEVHGRGQARMSMVREAGQLAGLGLAAVVVGLVGVNAAFLINAGSFALVAVLVLAYVPALPAPARGPDRVRGTGLRLLWDDRRLRVLNALVLVGTLAILPDAVMVPLVVAMGAPDWVVGPLLAADVVGFLLASLVLDRRDDATRRALIGPLVVLSVLPLAGFLVNPGPWTAAVLLVLSGVGAAHIPAVRAAVLELVPDEAAGRTVGWVRTGLRAGQGLGVVVGGVLADVLTPAGAIGAVGVAGTAAALVGAAAWHRRPPDRAGRLGVSV